MSLADESSLLFIPTGYRESKIYSVFPTTGVGDFTFNRNSSATRIAKNGLITSVATDIPRLEYPLIDGVVNGCPSLLLEPQRTNLFPYSSDYNQTDWDKFNITIESNSTISPDGTLNADKILEQVGSANGHFMFDNLGLSINTEYNFSVFVKKLNRRYVAIQNSYNTANGSIAFFDLDTETLVYTYSTGTVGTFIVSDAKIEKYPNGWYRLSANFQSDAAGGVLPSLVLANSQWSTGFSYNNTYTGDVTKGIYFWGAQLEEGSYPTSYIPTNGTTVTRLVDTANGAGDATTFNDSEGVLMAEISALSETTDVRVLSISDGTTSNMVFIRFDTLNRIIAEVTVLNGGSVNPLFIAPDITSFNKIALKWALNDVALWVNGIEVSTISVIGQFAPNTLNVMNLSMPNLANTMDAKTKQIQYYDSALTDSELEQLTSWTSFTDLANGQQYSIK